MNVVGLFSGIGGIEEGFRRAGLHSELLCECDPAARRVLRSRFPDVTLRKDIRDIKRLPSANVWAAGFPCQDLSQAGRMKGIGGPNSSLIGEVFRILAATKTKPEWLVFENVPFMLHLGRGHAMRVITTALEDNGYSWAYRVVDTMAFGLPQRRRRVVIVGSRTLDPRGVLLCGDAGERQPNCSSAAPRGFYWTEGRSGLGWAPNAVPPLKGGSGLGIPCSPAIWFPKKRLIATLDIRDAERLQGFRSGWTRHEFETERLERMRWRLVGNAVSVPVAEWVGKRLLEPKVYDDCRDVRLDRVKAWPMAAWGRKGRIWAADVSMWPVQRTSFALNEFLRYPVVPLSERATAGFYERARTSTLRFEDGFLHDVAYHLKCMRRDGAGTKFDRIAA